MNLLIGKYAYVTGGATGIGYGISKRLLEEGAKSVVLAARREDLLKTAVDSLQSIYTDARVSYQVCDITNEEEVKSSIEAACNDNGQLDICIANAGTGIPNPILSMDVDTWRFCCELNIIGSALCIKHAAAVMKDVGGNIITISSTAGSQVEKWMGPYSVSKAGLEMLTRCASVELAVFGIRVNSIAPGYVETDITEASFSKEFKAKFIEKTLCARAGRPDEIGNSVIYLCSELGEWVTGQILHVDGGESVPVGLDFIEVSRLMYGDDVMDKCEGKI